MHYMLLQLVSKGVIQVEVADVTKVGTEKVGKDHLIVTLGVSKDNDGDELPTYLLESAWEGMTYVESRKD